MQAVNQVNFTHPIPGEEGGGRSWGVGEVYFLRVLKDVSKSYIFSQKAHVLQNSERRVA